MADLMPAFPLKLITFPGEHLNLHIFEPRYKQLINECVERDVTFAQLSILPDVNTNLATELRVVKVHKRYEDGKMDIITEGIGLLKMEAFFEKFPNKLYPGIEYKRLPWSGDDGSVVKADKIIKKLIELYRIMNITNVKLSPPNEFKTYEIAHKVGFSVHQELEFLSLLTEAQRQSYLLSHVKKMLPIVKEMEEMRKKAEMNGEFRNPNAKY